jgi:ubiquinone/menaquinone biosynthesis C-methylase UbiE
LTEDKELELKRVWERMACTLPPEEVVFGPPGRKWSRRKDFETFNNLRSYLNITEREVLLDLGCGPLARSEVQFGLSGNPIVGVDVSRTALKKANETIKRFGLKKTVEFVLVDAEYLPFKDDTFDVAMCIGVISHLPSLKSVRRGLKEIRKTLRADGKIYVTWLLNVYSSWCFQEAIKFLIFGPDREQHLKFRGLPEINNVFSEARLQILKIRYGILFYKLTILFPHLPIFVQRRIKTFVKHINMFHQAHSLFSFFSRSFEVTAQKTNMVNAFTKADSFFEPPF